MTLSPAMHGLVIPSAGILRQIAPQDPRFRDTSNASQLRGVSRAWDDDTLKDYSMQTLNHESPGAFRHTARVLGWKMWDLLRVEMISAGTRMKLVVAQTLYDSDRGDLNSWTIVEVLHSINSPPRATGISTSNPFRSIIALRYQKSPLRFSNM